jgi:hypothetical protein
MKTKTDEIEDKAVTGPKVAKTTRRAKKTTPESTVDKETWVKPSRRGWDDASFARVMAKPSGTIDTRDGVSEEEATLAAQALQLHRQNYTPAPQDGVEIRMKQGRQWRIGDRLLMAGERVTLDETTAATIVEAGYAKYTEG